MKKAVTILSLLCVCTLLYFSQSIIDLFSSPESLATKGERSLEKGDTLKALVYLKKSIMRDNNHTNKAINIYGQIILEREKQNLSNDREVDEIELLELTTILEPIKKSYSFEWMLDEVYKTLINNAKNSTIDAISLKDIHDYISLSFHNDSSYWRSTLALKEMLTNPEEFNIITSNDLHALSSFVSEILKEEYSFVVPKDSVEKYQLLKLFEKQCSWRRELNYNETIEDAFQAAYIVTALAPEGLPRFNPEEYLKSAQKKSKRIMDESDVYRAMYKGFFLTYHHRKFFKNNADSLLSYEFFVPLGWKDYTKIVQSKDKSSIPKGLWPYKASVAKGDFAKRDSRTEYTEENLLIKLFADPNTINQKEAAIIAISVLDDHGLDYSNFKKSYCKRVYDNYYDKNDELRNRILYKPSKSQDLDLNGVDLLYIPGTINKGTYSSKPVRKFCDYILGDETVLIQVRARCQEKQYNKYSNLFTSPDQIIAPL